MAVWDDVFTKHEKVIFEKAGFGQMHELGGRPALLIIDVVYNFVGEKPEPILQSMERFPLSCGEIGWKVVDYIASFLPLVRSRCIPVIYSTGEPSLPPPWKASTRRKEIFKWEKGNEIVKQIAPAKNDVVIRKLAPSIFFGTPVMSILFSLKVDTLLICGGVTSGCIRATVVDAASYGFNVAVIEDCTFDRSETSHKVNLFDINAKYAKAKSVDPSVTADANKKLNDYKNQYPNHEEVFFRDMKDGDSYQVKGCINEYTTVRSRKE